MLARGSNAVNGQCALAPTDRARRGTTGPRPGQRARRDLQRPSACARSAGYVRALEPPAHCARGVATFMCGSSPRATRSPRQHALRKHLVSSWRFPVTDCARCLHALCGGLQCAPGSRARSQRRTRQGAAWWRAMVARLWGGVSGSRQPQQPIVTAWATYGAMYLLLATWLCKTGSTGRELATTRDYQLAISATPLPWRLTQTRCRRVRRRTQSSWQRL